MQPPTVVTFRGVTYRRFPRASHTSDQHYYRSSPRNGRVYLHRAIYAAINGPIPPAHRVIHRDGNPFNNAPVNLVALPAKAPAPRRTRQQMLRAAQNNLLDLAGRPCVCANCGADFTTYRKQATRFCSGRCRTAHWRSKHT